MLRKEFDAFLTIYEEKSLSRASDKLDSFQGGLSKLLAHLENELKYKLFIRSNRGLVPTPAADRLYSQIRFQKDTWQKFFRHSEGHAQEITGLLKIGGHESVLRQFSNSLATFIEDFPALDVQFEIARSPEIVRRVLNHDLDVGFVANPQKFSELVIKPILQEDVALYSNSKTPKGYIVYNPDLMSSTQIIKNLRQAPSKFITVKNYDLAAELAVELKGSALLPFNTAKKHQLNYQNGKIFFKANLCLVCRADHKIDSRLQKRLLSFK
jgi:DNA-binding transcriptional LysR family regulator